MSRPIMIALLVVALSIGIFSWQKNNAPTPEPTAQPAATTPGVSSEPLASCGFTVATTEGPYYVSGVPALTDNNLNYAKLEGSPLTVTGHVYVGQDTTSPVARAVLDIWQTDANGAYHPAGNGSYTGYKKEDIALRGTVMTDESGKYTFQTVYPGEYTGRPRHIHLKIRATGHAEVTTQLILAIPGDEIAFDDDTIAQGLPDCQVLKTNATLPPTSATFDFHIP